MNFKRGLANLDNILKQTGVAEDSDIYLDFTSWRRQLAESIENERRFAVLSPQEQERRERILRELDRLALKYADKSFTELCTISVTVSMSWEQKPNPHPELNDALNQHSLALFIGTDLPREVTGL